MKKILLMALGCFLVYAANAQDKEDVKKGTFGKLSQADRIVFNIYTDIWMGAPTDLMTIKKINRGADFYLMKEFPFGKSNFSFALGLGVGCHNLYSDATPGYALDSTGKRIYGGNTVFSRIPDSTIDNKGPINWKNNKFTQVYLDIPLEFRYRTRNNAFKIYLGGKVGLMLSNHTKYNGDDYTENYPAGNIRIKEYRIPNVQKFRYGLTARIGWKWIQAYAYYSLSSLFKKDKGPDMYPISLGLTISPY